MRAAARSNGARGCLIPIGGAESREGKAVILRRFVEVCGGAEADIVIIPTASRLRDTGERYEDVFLTIGARRARALRFRTPEDCADRGNLEAIESATGIFLTGGNQSRLTRRLLDTPAWEAIGRAYGRGVHVAGTSAGAAVMSERMIAWGESGSEPRPGMVGIERGFGLTDALIIDQHFRQRDRLGRLVFATALHPELIGLGVDEDTAAFIGPDDTLEILGRGSVTIVDVDPAGPDLDRGFPDVRTRQLSGGSRFDIGRREVLPATSTESRS